MEYPKITAKEFADKIYALIKNGDINAKTKLQVASDEERNTVFHTISYNTTDSNALVLFGLSWCESDQAIDLSECDWCHAKVPTIDLIQINSKDYVARENNILPKIIHKRYNALCEVCYTMHA